jgi:putative flavoprotein involved in K+ transport
MNKLNTVYDAIVIGAGQAGLATGYYLQQAGLRFLILESGRDPVGSWPCFYDSLSLNSAARYSSLPGLPFPVDPDGYPVRDEVVAYLRQYAAHFQLPIMSEARVSGVERVGWLFRVVTDDRNYFVTRALVGATGFFGHPFFPDIPGLAQYRGQVLHTANYHNPEPFRGQRVVIVGSANGAVQVGTELAEIAHVTLAARHPTRYLPQRFLGRDIHFWLTISGLDQTQWLSDNSPPVFDSGVYRRAIAAGRPDERSMFERFTENGVVWGDGRQEMVDTVIFATGYRPHLPYLADLGALDETGRVLQRQGVSTTVPGLYYVGLPRQRNVASATLRGVGPDAKIIVEQLWRDSQAQTGGHRASPGSLWNSRSSELVGLISLITLAAREQLATGNLPAPKLVGEAVSRSAIVGAGFLGIGSAASLYGQN